MTSFDPRAVCLSLTLFAVACGQGIGSDGLDTATDALTVATLQAEHMSYPTACCKVINDTSASGGIALEFFTNGTAKGSVSLLKPANQIVVRARGRQCQGAPHMVVEVDSKQVMAVDVWATSWSSYSAAVSLSAGGHSVAISFTNDFYQPPCDRNLFVDVTSLNEHAVDGGTGDAGTADAGSDAGTHSDAGTPVKADYFVDVADGNDNWSGKQATPTPTAAPTDGPFKTIGRAQAAVRSLAATRVGPIEVMIRQGTYFLSAPWTLCGSGHTTAACSTAATDPGTASTPVTYQAYPGEAPILSGGLIIGPQDPSSPRTWTQSGSTWTVALPTGTNFSQLWINGERRFRPRYAGTTAPYLRFGASSTDTSFTFAAGDLQTTWHNLTDVEVVAFEQWTVSRQFLQAVDTSTHIATTTAMHSTTTMHGYIPGHRYLVENVKESLAPGEWYLDRSTGVLTYLAQAGEDPNGATVIVAPNLAQVLTGDHVQYTTFKGLTFSHANWTVPSGGYSAGQGLWNIPAAVLFQDSSQVTLDGCTVAHVGGFGVDFQGNDGWSYSSTSPYNNAFVNGLIVDVGAGGLRVGAFPSGMADSAVAQGVHIANNLITGGGRFMPSGMAVIVGDSHHNVIEHNEISDFYQTAISIGESFASGTNDGVWSYPSCVTHDNLVQYNLIHDIGRGVTSDMGGVYLVTSNTTGNVVRNNVIHDVINDPTPGRWPLGGYGGNGTYFDQGTSNALAENNLIYRVSGYGHAQNVGRADVLRNNIFAYPATAAIDHSMYESAGYLWATFENNVFYFDRGGLQYENWICPGEPSNCTGTFSFKSNLYWNTAGSVSFRTSSPNLSGLSLSQWRANYQEDLSPRSSQTHSSRTRPAERTTMPCLRARPRAKSAFPASTRRWRGGPIHCCTRLRSPTARRCKSRLIAAPSSKIGSRARQ